MEASCDLEDHLLSSVEQELSHNDEQLLDKTHKGLVLIKEVGEGVKNQLSDKLVPKFLELGWQSKRT